ncbi:MAG: glycosyltransferase family 4 protein [bacterium]|jgi:glycosyltransferase involved in cell wall biosynthesis
MDYTAIDISFLGTSTGFGRYTQGLLHSLVRMEKDQPYLLIKNLLPQEIPLYRHEEELKDRLPSLPVRWKTHVTSLRHRVYWQYFELPKTLRTWDARIFHAFDNVTVPPNIRGTARILTLYDLIPITNPRFCRMRDALAANYLIRRAIRHADVLVTASRYSAERILEYFPQAESRLHMIYPGVDHQHFSPCADPRAFAEILAKQYHLFSSFYLLSVATLNPRRNLIRVLQAFARFLSRNPEQDFCLVIVGCRGWKEGSIFQEVEELNLSGRVHFLDFVPDEALVQLYQAAVGVINASMLEGFGLPVIEAMACGAPVMCSNTTALGEIAGDAALTFSPESSESMLDALEQFLLNEELRQSLRARGIEHAQRFQWDQAAAQIIHIYNQFR